MVKRDRTYDVLALLDSGIDLGQFDVHDISQMALSVISDAHLADLRF